MPINTVSSLLYFISESFIALLSYVFIYFWLYSVFVAVRRLSLATASRGCSLVAACGLLIAVAPLVAERGLQCVRASVVVACGPSCPEAHGNSPDRDWNPCPCAGRQLVNRWATRVAAECLDGRNSLLRKLSQKVLFFSFFLLLFGHSVSCRVLVF